VKFLLNMNVSRRLQERLRREGHQCRHAADIGFDKAPDTAIVEEARTHSEVIITEDLDYGHLLAFSGRSSPSVILLRVRNTHPDNHFHVITKTWAEIEKPLQEGAIVIVEDSAVRIRKLPIHNELNGNKWKEI